MKQPKQPILPSRSGKSTSGLSSRYHARQLALLLAITLTLTGLPSSLSNPASAETRTNSALLSNYGPNTSSTYRHLPPPGLHVSQQATIGTYELEVCQEANFQPWGQESRTGTYGIQPDLPVGLYMNTSTGQITGRSLQNHNLEHRLRFTFDQGSGFETEHRSFRLIINNRSDTVEVIRGQNLNHSVHPICDNLNYSYRITYSSSASWIRTSPGDYTRQGRTHNGNIGVSGYASNNSNSVTLTIRAYYTDSELGISFVFFYILKIVIKNDSVPNFTNSVQVAGQTEAFDSELTINAYIEADSPLPIVEGGDGRLKFSISPALPLGLELSNRGRYAKIVGTASAETRRTYYTLTVTDTENTESTSDDDFSLKTFYLTITNKPVFLEKDKLTRFDWQVGMHVDELFPPATGGDAPIRYSIVRNANFSASTSDGLPAGILFNNKSRELIGTPSETMGNGIFSLIATDRNGDSDIYFFTINVTLGLFDDGDRGPFTATVGKVFKRVFFVTRLPVSISSSTGLPEGFSFKITDIHPSQYSTVKALIFYGTATEVTDPANVSVQIRRVVLRGSSRVSQYENLNFTLNFVQNSTVTWEPGFNNTFEFPNGVFHSVTLPIARGDGKVSYKLASLVNSEGRKRYNQILPQGLSMVTIEHEDPINGTSYIPVVFGAHNKTYVQPFSYCFQAFDENGDRARLEFIINTVAPADFTPSTGSFSANLSTSVCDDPLLLS